MRKSSFTFVENLSFTCLKEKFIHSMKNRNDYSNIFRPKTRAELILLSSIVCGIEFCYSAETAFVTPTFLKFGVPINSMTIIWCFSPLVGFFLSPIIGSLSDTCRSSFGRRRPFIILLSLGIIIGLLLIPNGDLISKLLNLSHSWTVFITIIGAVLLDFCCDACQSPSRAFLFEVTLPEDHAMGLSTFTIMAGFGGAVGYLIGGIDWQNITFVQKILGSDHDRIVFILCAFAFIICAILTITSFRELPLDLLVTQEYQNNNSNYERLVEDEYEMKALCSTSTVEKNCENEVKLSIVVSSSPTATFFDYMESIIKMPASLRILCITNLFSWMSLVCYSLYFTDFVGESVFGGDPTSTVNSTKFQLYQKGVQFGCICMTFYSLSCSFYSYYFSALILIFGPKRMYIGSGLIYAFGMFMIAITRNKWCTIVFSLCAGIQYSTLFTMPYLLIAKYQVYNVFSDQQNPRGLGTDIAVVGSMVFLAQFILSLCMGSLIDLIGTNSVTVYLASFLSVCSAWFANKVQYIDD